MLTLKTATMLGPVPEEWEICSLRELLTAHFPGDWGEDRGAHMVGVLRSTNLTNNGWLDLSDVAMRGLPPERAEILAPRQGDILLERSGGGPKQPVGRVGIVDHDMPRYAFSNFIHLLRPDHRRIHPRYLGWLLWAVNRSGRILRLEQQTTQMRNLNFREYLLMPLPIPPRPEQERIAEMFDAVEASAERARRVVVESGHLKAVLSRDLFSGRVRA